MRRNWENGFEFEFGYYPPAFEEYGFIQTDMMRENIKAVIFDLDGTLINTMGSFADLAGKLISSHYGCSFEQGRQKYLKSSGIPFSFQLEVLFPGDARNPIVAEMFESQKISLFNRETVSENALETLYWLKENGYRTAISSNNFHYLVEEFVQRENIPVDVYLGYKKGFLKGYAHFHYLEECLGMTLSDMLFIGDSLKDAQIARENGVSFLGKIGTFTRDEFRAIENSHPIETIREIHEVVSYLEEKCKLSF